MRPQRLKANRPKGEECPKCHHRTLISNIKDFSGASVGEDGQLQIPPGPAKCTHCGLLVDPLPSEPDRPATLQMKESWLFWYRRYAMEQEPTEAHRCTAVLCYLAIGELDRAVEEYAKLIVHGLRELPADWGIETTLSIYAEHRSVQGRERSDEIRSIVEQWLQDKEVATGWRLRDHYRDYLRTFLSWEMCELQPRPDSDDTILSWSDIRRLLVETDCGTRAAACQELGIGRVKPSAAEIEILKSGPPSQGKCELIFRHLAMWPEEFERWGKSPDPVQQRFVTAVAELRRMVAEKKVPIEKALPLLFAVAPASEFSLDTSEFPYALTSFLLFGACSYFSSEELVPDLDALWEIDTDFRTTSALLSEWRVVEEDRSSGEWLMFSCIWETLAACQSNRRWDRGSSVENLHVWEKRDFVNGDPRPHEHGGRLIESVPKWKSLPEERKFVGIVALQWGFPLETYTVDHAVHCVLDTMSAVFAKCAVEQSAAGGSEPNKLCQYWDEWLQRLEQLRDFAVKGAIPETVTAVGEYVDVMRLIIALQKAENDPLREVTVRKAIKDFEQGRKPEEGLSLYLLCLKPVSSKDYKWYMDLLAMKEWQDHDNMLYNRAKRKGAFLSVAGLYAEQVIRARASEVASKHLGTGRWMDHRLAKEIAEALPGLFKKEFRERLKQAKASGLGFDHICRLTEGCLELDVTEEETVAGEVGIMIRRLELRLRGIIADQLGSELDSPEWYRQYNVLTSKTSLLDRIEEEAGRCFRDKKRLNVLALLTFNELWEFFNEAKVNKEPRFVPLRKCSKIRTDDLKACVAHIKEMRNDWAHHRDLQPHFPDFCKHFELLQRTLADYERLYPEHREHS